MIKSFAAAFFRIYDRKITSGEITFSQTGMKKRRFYETMHRSVLCTA